MPRGPRTDAPGAVHHVMIRGIERRRIFLDAADHQDFLARLDRLVPELGFQCFAWVLMPNHVHLALQTSEVPLARLMARLGTGYAVSFNRRYERTGHLVQNRYRSRLVHDDADLLGLVAYIHRNPLRAGLVGSLAELAAIAWCGHGTLAGQRPPRAFESPRSTLRLFDDDPTEARRLLLERMAPVTNADEMPAGAASDVDPTLPSRPAPGPQPLGNDFGALLSDVCRRHRTGAAALRAAVPIPAALAARSELAQRAAAELGLSSAAMAAALGLSRATIWRARVRERRASNPPTRPPAPETAESAESGTG